MVGGDGRMLRVDAARNHERIVTAAARALEEEGPAVSLEEIARRAGVGVATLYRRFGGRDQLIRAVFEYVVATDIVPAIVEGGPDPWRDLVDSLTATVEAISQHRVLVALARDTSAGAVTSYIARMERVLRRAQEAGVARQELTKRDLGAVVVMTMAISRTSNNDPADIRRCLALLTAGMRPAVELLPPGGG